MVCHKGRENYLTPTRERKFRSSGVRQNTPKGGWRANSRKGSYIETRITDGALNVRIDWEVRPEYIPGKRISNHTHGFDYWLRRSKRIGAQRPTGA